MLQRAASNAYSWWWASNIRTKQSKWLDNSLQEMEEKVKAMIKLIEEDADTFAKKAEMYFQRRPILINFVEEAYREYKSLADRYDHLSGELHKANHTIATAFPDQVQLAMQDDDDDSSPKGTLIDPSKLVKPSAVLQRISTLNKYKESRSSTRKPKPRFPVSAIDKDKAREEVDRLQKEILVLQTEREFVKSTYESSLAKFLEIEKQMTDLQDEVSYLQDEFSATVQIEDDDARALMVATALKSCEETLISLQEQQKKAIDEAQVESGRTEEVKKKLKALKREYGQPVLETPETDKSDVNSTTAEDEVCSLKQERIELNSICERVKEHFERNSGTSVAELAEKIDELVEKIIHLELTVSSQNAQITRLRFENDELQKHLYAFEEDKMGLIDDSNALNKRLTQAEDQLQRILDLEISVHNDKGMLQTGLKEAYRSLHGISDKLQSPTHQSEINTATPLHKKEDEKTQSCSDNLVEGREGRVDSETASHLPTDLDELQRVKQEGVGESNSQTELQAHGDSLENQQSSLAVRVGKDKILLDEYTSLLRDYRETKEKLSEVEKKSQDCMSEMIAQIRDLKSDNAKKEEELHALRQKLGGSPGSPKPQSEDSSTTKLAKYRKHRSRSLYSIMTEDRYRESKKLDATYFVENESSGEDVKLALIEEYTPSGIEEKFRTDIDNLLEENLDFWLRFCTSYHQIQKFKTRFQALQAEVEKLNDGKKQESKSTLSGEDGDEKESIPTDKKLRELNTELQVWLEQNGLLKVEIKKRSGSLGSIQHEIIKVLNDCQNVGVEFTPYQAAKYQGEVTNMQQENMKVASELKAGIDHVNGLQAEVGKLLSTLHKSLELPSPKKNHHQNQPIKHNSSKGRVPLRTFLFGTKPKKPSIFSCMSPAVRKHYNNIKHGMPS